MSDESCIPQDEEKDLPFYMNYLPEFVLKKCELELKETPDRKIQCIKELRNLIENDKKFENVCFHEDLLVQYLRHSKYNPSRALSQLRNLRNLRKKEPEIFESMPDEYFMTKSSLKVNTVLPKRTPDGCTVVLIQVGKWDTMELDVEDVKKMMLITFVQLLRDPMSQINGFKVIVDFGGTRFEHIKYCTPKYLYLLYYAGICCVPARYKEIHFINETPVLKILWTILKRFLSQKIRNRVMIHSNVDELLNYFPKSVLPEQYGGELQDMQRINFIQKANKYQKENSVGGQPNFF